VQHAKESEEQEPEPVTPLALEAFGLLDRDADGFLSESEFGVFALLCGGGIQMDIEALRLEVWSTLDVPKSGLSASKWLRLVLRGIPGRTLDGSLGVGDLKHLIGVLEALQKSGLTPNALTPSTDSAVSQDPRCGNMRKSARGNDDVMIGRLFVQQRHGWRAF